MGNPGGGTLLLPVVSVAEWIEHTGADRLRPMLLACGNSQHSKTSTVQKAPQEDPGFYASFYTGRPDRFHVAGSPGYRSIGNVPRRDRYYPCS